MFNQSFLKFIQKVVILGESGTGKTCLMNQLVDHTFDEIQKSTIGIDFKTYNKWVDNEQMHLQLWDTAGQERYRSLCSSCYRGAHAYILVVDLTRPETLTHLDDWLKSIGEESSDLNHVIYLVGNKQDLGEACRLTLDQLNIFAQLNNISRCYMTSAKTGECVDKIFEQLAKDLHARCMQNVEMNPIKPPIKIQREEEEDDCCGFKRLTF